MPTVEQALTGNKIRTISEYVSEDSNKKYYKNYNYYAILLSDKKFGAFFRTLVRIFRAKKIGFTKITSRRVGGRDDAAYCYLGKSLQVLWIQIWGIF